MVSAVTVTIAARLICDHRVVDMPVSATSAVKSKVYWRSAELPSASRPNAGSNTMLRPSSARVGRVASSVRLRSHPRGEPDRLEEEFAGRIIDRTRVIPRGYQTRHRGERVGLRLREVRAGW